MMRRMVGIVSAASIAGLLLFSTASPWADNEDGSCGLRVHIRSPRP